MPLASYAEHIRTRKNQLDKDLEHIIEKIKYAQTIEELKDLNEHISRHLFISKQILEDIMEIITDPELSEILDIQSLNRDNQELSKQLLKKEKELTKAKEYIEKIKDELKNKDSLIKQTKDELAKAKEDLELMEQLNKLSKLSKFKKRY